MKKMLSVPHINCLRSVEQIADEIRANVAEYASMAGIGYQTALRKAETHYLDMLFAIRGVK